MYVVNLQQQQLQNGSLWKRKEDNSHSAVCKMASKGKSNSQFFDSSYSARSGFESILRPLSFTDTSNDDKLLAEEVTDGSWGTVLKPFVKLKRDHWVESKLRSSCTNCLKSFGFTSKKFNCRRCGEIFCEKCCHYRRRLSPDAKPSKDGHYYRVCYRCSDIGIQPFGETRSLTEFFKSQRSSKRINVLHELHRLVEGFTSNVKATKLDSVMTDTISNIKVPLWQRSYKWLESKEVDWCSKCSAKFKIFMQKHHCRICGSVFCHKCCNQDLMLYYGDDSVAEWSIIRVVGCPDEEPNVCLYLTMCNLCHEEVESIQVSRFYSVKSNVCKTNALLGSASAVTEKMNTYEARIRDDLVTYQEMVENMVDGQGKLNEISGSGQSIVQIFAKLQIDISDQFSQYADLIYELKNLTDFKSSTQTEWLLIHNILKTKSKFYNKNMATFKYYKENLSKTMPPAGLQEVQNYSDKQAINSTRITTRLLGLELLHICGQNNLEPTVAQKVSELDGICFEELQSFIRSLGENWGEHCRRLDSLVKEMFQSKRMVVPSKRLIQERQDAYLKPFLLERCCEVLQQTQRQMLARSSKKKFVKSKDALEKLIEALASKAIQF